MQWSEGVCSSQISVQFIHCMTTVNTLLLLEHLVTSPKRLSILQRPILRLESTIIPTSSFPPNPHSWPRSHSWKAPFSLGRVILASRLPKTIISQNARRICHFFREICQKSPKIGPSARPNLESCCCCWSCFSQGGQGNTRKKSRFFPSIPHSQITSKTTFWDFLTSTFSKNFPIFFSKIFWYFFDFFGYFRVIFF